MSDVTRDSLRRDLAALGVRSGDTIVVHSSQRAIGWVDGGAPTVIDALLDALGPSGTLAMPAATPQLADPATWDPAPVGEELERLRATLPEFDRAATRTTLGAIPEAFRRRPGTRRSDHPLESVCAAGEHAARITDEHPLAFSEGEGSPFHTLHELGARILLLGVGFNRCTALHLAETLSPRRRVQTCRFVRSADGRREWIEIPNVADDLDTHFPIIGERYLESGPAARGTVGAAASLLVPMRPLVRFALSYFNNR